MVKIGHHHLIGGMAWVPDLEAPGQDLTRTKGQKTQARRWGWNFEIALGRPSEAEIAALGMGF